MACSAPLPVALGSFGLKVLITKQMEGEKPEGRPVWSDYVRNTSTLRFLGYRRVSLTEILRVIEMRVSQAKVRHRCYI